MCGLLPVLLHVALRPYRVSMYGASRRTRMRRGRQRGENGTKRWSSTFKSAPASRHCALPKNTEGNGGRKVVG